jgi:hypothetical protein
MGRKLLKASSEILVPVYPKTNIPSLQSFLRSKVASWASKGSSKKVLRKQSLIVSIVLSHIKKKKKFLILNTTTRK